MTPEVAQNASRWHWLWFGPLCALTLLMSEGHTLPYAVRVFQLGWQRWFWGALLSPSADFCWTVVIFSVVAPILGLFFAVSSMFSTSGSRRRYLQSVLILAAVLLLPFLTDALIWGSFPFTIDNEGVHRLRMIPFFPWPDAPFGQY